MRRPNQDGHFTGLLTNHRMLDSAQWSNWRKSYFASASWAHQNEAHQAFIWMRLHLSPNTNHLGPSFVFAMAWREQRQSWRSKDRRDGTQALLQKCKQRSGATVWQTTYWLRTSHAPVLRAADIGACKRRKWWLAQCEARRRASCRQRSRQATAKNWEQFAFSLASRRSTRRNTRATSLGGLFPSAGGLGKKGLQQDHLTVNQLLDSMQSWCDPILCICADSEAMANLGCSLIHKMRTVAYSNKIEMIICEGRRSRRGEGGGRRSFIVTIVLIFLDINARTLLSYIQGHLG